MTPPGAYKTPGVFIVEKDAYPSAAAAVVVDMAVPAFIGYSEKVVSKGQSAGRHSGRYPADFRAGCPDARPAEFIEIALL